MESAGKTNKYSGFTIVELLVVIVVIGILAAIIITAYKGVQQAAAKATIQSDLANAARQMGVVQSENGAYPDVLPTDIRSSPGVTLTLIKRTGGYSGLDDVQMGVLFQNVCQEILNEGYGTGTNLAGEVEQYVTGCNVYGHAAIQLNGWTAHDFSTSIAQSSVYNWYDAHIGSDLWRPNEKSVYLAFATELTNRFMSLGGSFPVSSFWDPWAAANNGGVPYEALPNPSMPSDPNNFCIEGSHVKYTSLLMHVAQDGAPQTGSCP